MRSTKINEEAVHLAMLLLRLFLGIAMLMHGFPKLEKLMDGGNIEFMNFLGLGPTISLVLVVFAEFICSILLILGLLTRWSLIPLIITMLVAVFGVHINDGFEKMELGLHYLAGYFIVLIIGAGKYSIDGILAKRKERYAW
jgi:putative oxidoreductase